MAVLIVFTKREAFSKSVTAHCFPILRYLDNELSISNITIAD